MKNLGVLKPKALLFFYMLFYSYGNQLKMEINMKKIGVLRTPKPSPPQIAPLHIGTTIFENCKPILYSFYSYIASLLVCCEQGHYVPQVIGDGCIVIGTNQEIDTLLIILRYTIIVSRIQYMLKICFDNKLITGWTEVKFLIKFGVYCNLFSTVSQVVQFLHMNLLVPKNLTRCIRIKDS